MPDIGKTRAQGRHAHARHLARTVGGRSGEIGGNIVVGSPDIRLCRRHPERCRAVAGIGHRHLGAGHVVGSELERPAAGDHIGDLAAVLQHHHRRQAGHEQAEDLGRDQQHRRRDPERAGDIVQEPAIDGDAREALQPDVEIGGGFVREGQRPKPAHLRTKRHAPGRQYRAHGDIGLHDGDRDHRRIAGRAHQGGCRGSTARKARNAQKIDQQQADTACSPAPARGRRVGPEPPAGARQQRLDDPFQQKARRNHRRQAGDQFNPLLPLPVVGKAAADTLQLVRRMRQRDRRLLQVAPQRIEAIGDHRRRAVEEGHHQFGRQLLALCGCRRGFGRLQAFDQLLPTLRILEQLDQRIHLRLTVAGGGVGRSGPRGGQSGQGLGLQRGDGGRRQKKQADQKSRNDPEQAGEGGKAQHHRLARHEWNRA